MDAFGHKADKSKVNIGEMLTANDKEFYFDYQNGEYGFNTDPDRGAATFIPFKSGGAVLIGTYSANTTIDVSAYGATSADQFLAVCDTTKQNHISTATASSGGFNATADYYPPSMTMSNSNLTVNVGTLRCRMADYAGMRGDATVQLSTKVYYVGDIESNT